jgi:hypothetical protein
LFSYNENIEIGQDAFLANSHADLYPYYRGDPLSPSARDETNGAVPREMSSTENGTGQNWQSSSII